MSSLKAFLNPVKIENKEVVVSDRFKENGKPVPFIIRPISETENKDLMKKHTKENKKGKEHFDRYEYIHELVASAVVFPDLTSAELQEVYGLGTVKCLSNMLNVGEFAVLSEAVTELSGLDTDINDKIEEAKN
ncbi:MAG: XkdN-like protein [Herbinix sp.]|jgi:hypothetical protein|nr:XkdN-like protein [Herbinix sp.]